MNAVEREPLHPQKHAMRAVTLTLDDPPTRMFLLARLMAKIESGEALPDLLEAGMAETTIDRLRGMTLSDALRFSHTACGLALSVQPYEIEQQVQRVERNRFLQQLLEYFIRNGATPSLLTKLFNLTPTEARRQRMLLAPSVTTGGRPKQPSEDEHAAITAAWHRLQKHTDIRERVWHLHQEFSFLWISTLELVVLPGRLTLTPIRD